MTPEDLIARLGLSRHPEGGWYRQTWVEGSQPRASGTCIYFLLKEGEASHWHKVDATEIWHFYTGQPIELRLSATDHGPAEVHSLGPDFNAGQVPQLIVPEGYWQMAAARSGWALVGCTVSPGFEFDGFTLAAPGFDIPTGQGG